MRATKNILHVMGMDSTKYGGIERFNVALSHQLADKGFHSVFVYERWPDVEQFANDLQEAGAEIIVLNSCKNPLKFCAQLWDLMHKYRFCMMHAHFTKARFYAVPIALLSGIRNIVYTLHSVIPPLQDMKFHTRLWYRLFNRYCRVVAVSKQIESVASANWPDLHVKNIYMGIQPISGDKQKCRTALKIAADETMVMCTANFNHIKGLDILVHAIKKLSDEMDLSNVSFYIVGQPEEDKTELSLLAKKLDISSYIHLEGISNCIPQYLCASDIYVQPSRSEGIGLTLMEACAASLPIVASNVGGIPEVAVEGKNAILFEPESVDACAKALRTFIVDTERRKKYAATSYSVYLDKFTINKNVAELVAYYKL